MTDLGENSEKKKISGCMLVLGSLFFLSALVIGLFGYEFYKVFSSPEGKAALRTMKATTDLVIKSSAGPGAQALREMGCQQAMTFDPQDIAATIQQITQEDEASSATNETSLDLQTTDKLLLCAFEEATDDAKCKTFVRGFRQASSNVTEPISIVVSVFDPADPFMRQTSNHLCSGKFDNEGNRIGDIGPAFELLNNLISNGGVNATNMTDAVNHPPPPSQEPIQITGDAGTAADASETEPSTAPLP